MKWGHSEDRGVGSGSEPSSGEDGEDGAGSGEALGSEADKPRRPAWAPRAGPELGPSLRPRFTPEPRRRGRAGPAFPDKGPEAPVSRLWPRPPGPQPYSPPHTRCLGPVNTSSWCERPVVWPRLRPGTSRGEHATPANASRATRRPLRLLPSAACRGSVYGDDVQSGQSAAAAQRLSPHRPLCRDLCSVGLARGPLESDFVYLLWSAPAPHQPSPAGAHSLAAIHPQPRGRDPGEEKWQELGQWASGRRPALPGCPGTEHDPSVTAPNAQTTHPAGVQAGRHTPHTGNRKTPPKELKKKVPNKRKDIEFMGRKAECG